MDKTISVLSPVPEEFNSMAEPAEHSLRASLGTLEGTTIAVVNNGWHSMDVLARVYASHLRSDYGVREVIEVSVPPTEGLSADQVDDLAGWASAVVVGVGH